MLRSFFLSVFSHIRIEYGTLFRKFPYSVQILFLPSFFRQDKFPQDKILKQMQLEGNYAKLCKTSKTIISIVEGL